VEALAHIVNFSIHIALVLLWAKWSRLDVGLRPPLVGAAWPWIALFSLWIGTERLIATIRPIEVDSEWIDWLQGLSFLEDFAYTVVLAPVFEELLFRGAMFAALLRRWGIWAATIVPSILWAALHVQYEAWYVVSIAGSGVVLAMARWRSGSLYVPLALHAAANLLDLLLGYLPSPAPPA